MTPQEQINAQIKEDLARESRSEQEKDVLKRALESSMDIMQSLRAARGESYGRLVEIGVCVQKLQQLNRLLVAAANKEISIPPEALTVLAKEAATPLMANILTLAYRLSGLNSIDATELMGWADRIIEAEEAGVKGLVAELVKKTGE